MSILNSFLTKIKAVKSPVWIGIIVMIPALLLILFSSQVLYDRTVLVLTDNLRDRLLTISITAAANIDAADLDELQGEADWQKPEWERVVTRMNRAKYSNEDIVFMYIFRKTAEDSSQMEFIADADSLNPYANTDNDTSNDVDVNRDGILEPDGPDYLQWPGQSYPEAVDIPEAFAAYHGPITSADLYTDEYGTVLTGYAPIYYDNGEVAAILATDIVADDFFTITTQTLRPFIIFIVFLTLIITVLTISIIFGSLRYSAKIEESAAKLAKANRKLKLMDKMKSEFVSIASHQLRSPLTSIRGYASMLLEGSFGKISPKAKDAIERISESSRYMALSVEDYLNVSRIEAGRMKYELSDFNLKEMVEQITDDVRPGAMKKGLVVVFKSTELAGRGLVHADPGKTHQIIHNLLDNAMKYTPKGKIHISLRDDKKKKRTYVDVIDTGVGMSKETLEDVFEKFVRAKNANKVNVTGTGLGLFVAKKMAEGMGGTITPTSNGEGEGSTFTLELPYSM